MLLSFFLIVLCFIQFSKKVNSTPYFPLISGILVIFLLVFTVVPGIYRDVSRPVPILKSLWLILHVTFSVIGEAFFFLAFITSVLLLVSKTTNKINQYDTLTSLFTIAGFFFFTTGALIFGAIWAQQAWGSYWSWDPKETWALITGLVYTLYLHLKYIRKVKTKFLAFVSIGGFIFTLFTLFGVSCFFKGFHSY
ncbi:MAG: cytochrome c biogenesis protein CcsA [Spirochaetales bacterium]|nr:cytochrome c biogenesis protein CcsA [Spirochaetales bacterium]